MSRLRVRFLHASCLLLSLTVFAPTLGCEKNGLVETSFPSDGVQLRYDLKPGASFEGEVIRAETITMRGDSMNRRISFSVALQVTGIEADGSARVAATVRNIELNWNVPGLPISMNEFNAKAKKMLEGVTIRFAVRPDGSVSDVPVTPPEFGEAEAGVLESVIEGLTAAFFVVPDKKLMAAETWNENDSRGREGKLGKYTVANTAGTMVGMFERTYEVGEERLTHEVAKLDIDTDKTETTTTKDGSSEIRTRGSTTVLFDMSGYMAVIDSKQTRIQGATSSTVDFQANWRRKGDGVPVEQPSDAAKQNIADPCNDNYVGELECTDPCNSNYMGDATCVKPDDIGGEHNPAAPADEPAPAADPAAPATDPATPPAG